MLLFQSTSYIQNKCQSCGYRYGRNKPKISIFIVQNCTEVAASCQHLFGTLDVMTCFMGLGFFQSEPTLLFNSSFYYKLNRPNQCSLSLYYKIVPLFKPSICIQNEGQSYGHRYDR